VQSLKDTLLRELSKIEGVTAQASSVSGGTALFYRGKEFAHFHHENEVDLRLTKKVIQAMGLTHPQGSVHHPTRGTGSPWIEVRYQDNAGVKSLLELVRIAVKQL